MALHRLHIKVSAYERSYQCNIKHAPRCFNNWEATIARSWKGSYFQTLCTLQKINETKYQTTQGSLQLKTTWAHLKSIYNKTISGTKHEIVARKRVDRETNRKDQRVPQKVPQRDENQNRRNKKEGNEGFSKSSKSYMHRYSNKLKCIFIFSWYEDFFV